MTHRAWLTGWAFELSTQRGIICHLYSAGMMGEVNIKI